MEEAAIGNDAQLAARVELKRLLLACGRGVAIQHTEHSAGARVYRHLGARQGIAQQGLAWGQRLLVFPGPQFWQQIRATFAPRDRAGRIKQWVNYPRQLHPEAEELWGVIRQERRLQAFDAMLGER